MLVLVCIYFFWYVFWGFNVDRELSIASKKREDLLSLSETIMSQYKNIEEQKSIDKNIAIIDKRIAAMRSKMVVIDSDIKRFNQETIAVDEIVLLLRDLLSANNRLTLESLRVHPSEIVKREGVNEYNAGGAFEKNTISLKLKGDYVNVFDYLKKIESLEWSVFWEDINYIVESYPQAMVDIKLYTLSIIEGEY
ncbi:hypothetical protein AB835_09285 [Candidatus Endobugula sertula]|uniref:MSHA biogenesis protein MshJ n=1 Tax=Candidatus Endobugula sertula TaxID=62101 RepID=A0A1D2QP41_9GAMM|nr:hypothetical protein AB835_09285 [Candidatus Endobugula sertula]